MLRDAVHKPAPEGPEPFSLQKSVHGLEDAVVDAIASLHIAAQVRYTAATGVILVVQAQCFGRQAKSVPEGELDEGDRRARPGISKERLDVLRPADNVELAREDLDPDWLVALEEATVGSSVVTVECMGHFTSGVTSFGSETKSLGFHRYMIGKLPRSEKTQGNVEGTPFAPPLLLCVTKVPRLVVYPSQSAAMRSKESVPSLAIGQDKRSVDILTTD